MTDQGSLFGTVRVRTRADILLEIKETAWRRLAEDGRDGLSLRAIARELGVVSSALYRYFPSRERLVQTLVDDAHRDLVQRVQRAVRQPDLDRRASWRASCAVARDWARAHPHQFALLDSRPLPPALLDVLAPLTGRERALLARTLLLGLIRFSLLPDGDEAVFDQGVDTLAALLLG